MTLAVPLLTGCTRTRPDDPYAEVPSGAFVQGWRADLQLGRDRVSAIDVVGDQVLVRTESNAVYAISADGGTVRWASQVLPPGRTLGTPVLTGDRIIFPTTGELIVYSTQGKRLREIDLNRAVRSGITPDGEFLYLGFDYGQQGRLGRVSLESPYVPVRWELMNRGAVSAAPAVFQGVIYSASEDGNVYAVTEERLPIWALPGNVFSTGGPILADVQVDDTGVYVASTDSKLYAIDRVNGKIRWQYFAGAPLRTAPLLTGDSLYQPVPGKGVAALDKLAGSYNREPRWIAPAAVRALAADANHVFLQGADNSIYAVDKKTGEPAFKTGRPDLAIFAPSSGRLLFAATPGGVVYGIRPVKTGGTVGQMVLGPVEEATLGG